MFEAIKMNIVFKIDSHMFLKNLQSRYRCMYIVD